MTSVSQSQSWMYVMYTTDCVKTAAVSKTGLNYLCEIMCLQ